MGSTPRQETSGFAIRRRGRATRFRLNVGLGEECSGSFATAVANCEIGELRAMEGIIGVF